jgi:fatty-acyl-CoA synthase
VVGGVTTFEGPPLASAPGPSGRGSGRHVDSLTLGAVLEAVAARFGPGDCLVFDDPLRGGTTVRWTYADLRAQARRVGRALVARGVEPGDVVGILMGNRPEAVAALFGAAAAGAVVVPMSTFAPPPELAHMLAAAQVSVVLTQDRLLTRRFPDDLRAVAPELARPCEVVSVPDGWDAFLASGDTVDERALDARLRATTADDDALVIFSSGTTDAPKGILHRHRGPALQSWWQARVFGRHPATRMWTAFPLFWTAGLNTAMGGTLAAGGCWVMQETFEPGEALALLAREGVTEPYALPHQGRALAEHPDWAATDLSALRCVFGTSVFPRHPSVTGDPAWGMPVGYGLSETCAFFAAHPSDTPRERKRRSSGRLLPGNRLRVLDPDTGRPLGPGREGELAVAGPTLMHRYLGRTPAECFDADGFFRTGDTGFADEDGELHFTGRLTEMIRTGGANVSPAEIEVQLRACAPVKLARVVGVPDARLDQVPVACITLRDGAEATADGIRAFLRERVAPYKVPRHVLFFADGEIPLTAGGTKVRDEALLALVADRLASEPVPSEPVPTTGDR